MVSISSRTALIAGLLLIEPAYLLTSSTANFMKKHIQHTVAFCAYKSRCIWRDIRGAAGFSVLPEELLVEIVQLLDWRDILHIRGTSKQLNAVSTSLSVWRSVVGRVPPRLLWLERPIKTYSSHELEKLFLRRQRAVAGYEALAKGTTPHWRTINVKESPEKKTMDVVPGGRWLLVPNARGSILYYDLDAHDSPAQVLTPEKPANCLTKMSIDVDSTSAYLKFNLALVFYFLRGSDHQIEVWQVDLVLDEYGQGIGLRAGCKASFKQEPPGLCDSLCLLGDNLAFTVIYEAHLASYTAVVDWRLVQGSDYPKRLLYPSNRFSACVLPGNILVSAIGGDIMLVPCASLPVVTVMPNSSLDIPRTNKSLVSLKGAYDKTLSIPCFEDKYIRFLLGARKTVHGITLTLDPTHGDHKYKGDTIELFRLSESQQTMPIAFCEDFSVVWSRSRGMIVQRVSWSHPVEKCFPVVQVDRVAPLEWRAEGCYRLDMASGRVVVDQLRRQRVMVLELSP